MTTVIAFDVNETLLDLSSLDPEFGRVFGDAALRRQWFAQMLALAMTGGITDDYVSFNEAQYAAVEMLAERLGINVSEADARSIVGGMQQLVPHPDVADGLALLRPTGATIVALTSSEFEVAESQLVHAGIRQYFDRVHSADEVRRLKPAREPYRMVADAHDVPIDRVWLVAAHAWDVSGALAAGCHAAFIRRPGMVPSPIGNAPDVEAADLIDLANQLATRLSD